MTQRFGGLSTVLAASLAHSHQMMLHGIERLYDVFNKQTKTNETTNEFYHLQEEQIELSH